MPRARGNGEGSVYAETVKRANGHVERWVAQVVVNGRKRRQVAKTEALAKRKLREMLHATDAGLPLTPGDLTVADLLNQWETKHLPNRNLEPATVIRHRSAVRMLSTPERIGTKKVRTLTPEQIEDDFEVMAANGTARATLMRYKGSLAMALDWAQRRGVVARNVARVVELPVTARPSRTGKSMTAVQAKALLSAAEGTPLAAMWVTMTYLGLRPGEAAGLSWEDVDFAAGIIHVRQGRKLGINGAAIIGVPKTAWSVRSLDAPPPVIQALRAHRKRQAADRLAVGELWHNEHDLVFTSPTGHPTDPSACRHAFAAVVAKANLGPGWTPNSLRHSAASLMADAGVPIEEVADQLGHRDTRMASLHYRHRIKPTVAGGTVLGNVLGLGANK